MSLLMRRNADGAVTLGKAEVGPNNGHFAQSAGDNPPLSYLPTLDGTRYQEILSAARKAGMVTASPETLAAWLRGQGADVERELATADPRRMAMICGTILRTLAIESMPVGANVPQPAPIPTELSRLDARNQAGRNATERAVRAMRQHSPAFAAAGFDEQIALAGAALRQGQVIA